MHPVADPSVPKPLPAFGFLTALEDPDHGFFGGYLVLSELGRPLEFHCSTPVLPNVAQRILYGATLRSYLLSDLIGQALLAKSQLHVQAVLTDQPDMLGVTLVRDEFVVCVENEDCDAPPTAAPEVPSFRLGKYRLFGSSTCTWQAERLSESVAALASHVDLQEPFERVREAIREAQRLTDQSTGEQHDLADAA